MSNRRSFHVSLFVNSFFDGTVQADSEDDAIAETYRIWRTECPHPFEQNDDELIQVIAKEVHS